MKGNIFEKHITTQYDYTIKLWNRVNLKCKYELKIQIQTTSDSVSKLNPVMHKVWWATNIHTTKLKHKSTTIKATTNATVEMHDIIYKVGSKKHLTFGSLSLH